MCLTIIYKICLFLEKTVKTETNWTEYYSKKKSIFSTITQKFTEELIETAVKRYANTDGISILELGGGNSCFVDAISCIQGVERYDVIDNNRLSIDLFQKKQLSVKSKGIMANLLDDIRFEDQYDFVYSIGLIEHFSREDIGRLIQRHFDACKEGGCVLISYPTPTKKYKFWRKLMELTHVWQFWDERPLTYADIKDFITPLGKVCEITINKKLLLSQQVLICTKK